MPTLEQWRAILPPDVFKQLEKQYTEARNSVADSASNMESPARSSKYNATKIIIDGIKFDSKKEGKYYRELKAMKASGKILDFALQFVFQVTINGISICKYRADFKVFYPDNRAEIWDVKGFKTPDYRLKKKMVEAQYGIKIIEK